MSKKNKNNKGDSFSKSDTELNVIIDENKKKAAVGKIILAVGIAVGIALCFITIYIGVPVGIIIAAVGLYKITTAEGEVKALMAEAALVPALNEVFDKVTYAADEHIPTGVIKNTDMGFFHKVEKVYGSDYIKAEYQGVGIELSDIKCTYFTEWTDDDGDSHEEEHTIFKGLWLICDFHKQFTADLLLRERDGMMDKLLKSGIKTESEAFNKQFYIQSESEHDVFYVLTPHMMEYIQAMDKKADARTYMRFLKQGKLVLALDSGRDAFEVNNIKKATAESLREQFIAEVKYVTDLIDELKLVKTLHAKPKN